MSSWASLVFARGANPTPPPPPPPSLATLSGDTAAVAQVAETYTVTLDELAEQAYTVTWSTDGTASAPTSPIGIGETSASVNVTWPGATTGSVDFLISPSLVRAGRPKSVTVAAAPVASAPSGNIAQYLTGDGGSASYSGNFSGPTRDYWHRRLGFAWKRTNTAGNWLDSAQTEDGSVAYGSCNAITAVDQVCTIVATALVARWLVAGHNRGAYLRSRSGITAFPVAFYGRTDATSGNRPKLIVETSTGTFTLTAAANAYWYNSTFSASGAASEWRLASDAAFAVLRFDLSSVTGTLVSAELTFKVKSFPSGGTTGQIVDLFECDPPTIVDPITVGAPVLGVRTDYDDFGAYKGSGLPAILLADDFEAGGPFDTGFTPSATRTLNSDTGTTYARGTISIGAHGSCDINKSVSTGTGTGGAPNVVYEELYGQYSLYLESTFGTTNDDAIKIPAMGVQFGYWKSAGGGYWQQTTGNGGNVGTGLKVNAFTADNTESNFEYEGHSVRLLTGTEPTSADDDAYEGWFGIGIYPYNLDQVDANPAGEPFPYIAIRKEAWYTFDIRVQQNTMTGSQDGLGNYATANADGIYQVWIAGLQVYSKTTFRWRRHEEFGVQGLWLDVYHGGGTTAPRDMHYRLDRVSISTDYIGPPLPAWAAGAAVNEWREIPGSAMSLAPPTVNPGPSSPVNKFQAWNGLSIDTRGNVIWGLANGGHGDYYGNEVMRIDLMASEPAWVEMLPSSAADQVSGTAARYLDGKPSSAHSYYGQQFMELHDRAIRVGGSYSGGGDGFDVVEGWNASAAQGVNGWDPLGTYPPFAGVGGSQLQIDVPIAKHPTTEVLYLVPAENGTVRKFTPNASTPGGSWSNLGSAFVPFPSNGAACAIDTIRNRMLCTHGGNSAGSVIVTPYTVDLTTGVWTAQSYPASAAKTQLDALKSSPGLVYVPTLDAYLLRGAAAGATVFKIDAATFDVSILSTTGGASVPGGYFLDLSPNKSYENNYTRWLLAPGLRGIVYFPKYDESGWFLRLY